MTAIWLAVNEGPPQFVEGHEQGKKSAGGATPGTGKDSSKP